MERWRRRVIRGRLLSVVLAVGALPWPAAAAAGGLSNVARGIDWQAEGRGQVLGGRRSQAILAQAFYRDVSRDEVGLPQSLCGAVLEETYGALQGWAPSEPQLARMCVGALVHTLQAARNQASAAEPCSVFAASVAAGRPAAIAKGGGRLPPLAQLKVEWCSPKRRATPPRATPPLVAESGVAGVVLAPRSASATAAARGRLRGLVRRDAGAHAFVAVRAQIHHDERKAAQRRQSRHHRVPPRLDAAAALQLREEVLTEPDPNRPVVAAPPRARPSAGRAASGASAPAAPQPRAPASAALLEDATEDDEADADADADSRGGLLGSLRSGFGWVEDRVAGVVKLVWGERRPPPDHLEID